MATSQRRLSAILHGVNGTSVDAGREAQHVAAAFGAVRLKIGDIELAVRYD
jgi:hypothetical protein